MQRYPTQVNTLKTSRYVNRTHFSNPYLFPGKQFSTFYSSCVWENINKAYVIFSALVAHSSNWLSLVSQISDLKFLPWLDNAIPTTEYRNSFNPPSLYGSTQDQNFIQNPIQCLDLCPETICVCSVVSLVHFVSYLFDSVFNFLFQFK